MLSKLAILGGESVRRRPFPPRNTIQDSDKRAVMEVLESQCLSGFLGAAGPQFLGGSKMKEFEVRCCERFGYKHAVAVNSWTSGLMAAIGAAGLGPGDEVICSPYTMSASATMAFFYGAIPVFADIDPDTFCLDPAAVEKAVNHRTKAIVVVHLFGQPADMEAIAAIADKHGLVVIEDAAQAPTATYKGRCVGALRDLGGFSFNYHKHIHAGEGGVIVTDDDRLAQRCQLIRNHGENLIEDLGLDDISNLVGGNFRLTELQAAIGLAQLERVDDIVRRRQELAAHLSRRLAGAPGLRVPVTPADRTHVYYVFPIQYDDRETGVPRQRFIEAVNAELPPIGHSDEIPLSGGYVKPLYLSPVYQRRIAIGSKGFPFNANPNVRYEYPKGLCPVAEHMHERKLMLSFLVRDPLSTDDMDDLADALLKVAENVAELRDPG